MKRDLAWDLANNTQITRPAFAYSTFITYDSLQLVPYYNIYPLPNKNLYALPDLSKSHFHNLTITGPKIVFLLLDMSWTFENKIDAMKLAAMELIDSLSEWD